MAYLKGMPVYVFNGIPVDVDEDRWHGQDECILVSSFYQCSNSTTGC